MNSIMIKKLFAFFFIVFTGGVFAQAPTIEGDVMLCPYTDGTATITNTDEYDSYQWYFKYWFLNDDFEAIEGANAASFTYDWYTYDQALLKVVVTKDGQTYESNEIQIDSYNWSSLLIRNQLQGNVHFEFDEETLQQKYVMCTGAKIVQTVLEPYTIVQWYKDGVAIEGATSITYTITEPGVYNVVAGVEICPNATSASIPVNVVASDDCGPATPSPLVIQGDSMLCPDTYGLTFVTNAVGYDTYQWYAKFGGEEEFTAIEGATVASFEYDWNTYDQATLKVVATIGEDSYESNTIFIDSYNWLPLSFTATPSEDVEMDGPDYLICEGDTVALALPGAAEDYINIQWFKDGLPLEDGYEASYVATTPGVYHVDAAMAVCANNIMSTYDNPLTITANPDCTLGVNDPSLSNAVTVYPNPTNNILNIALAENSPIHDYSIVDVSGKVLLNGKINASLTAINVESLSSGTYFIKLNGNNAQAVKMFIRN